MLTCHGCMRHCLQSLIGDSTLLTASSRPGFTSNFNRLPLRRSYTGTSYERSQAGRGDASSNNRGRFDGRDSELERNRFEKKAGASPRLIQRKQWLDSRGIRPPSKKQLRQENTETQIRQHLKYLNDPLQLADFVRQTLRNDKFEFAQELVRTASKNMLCVVSWNHLVEYQLSKGRMNAAIQTYNEMKKRAQIPNAQTYSIMFTGCAQHKESNAALPKVLTIYQSMFAENSPVKPNTIHMNCVLKMCSKAGNMDALFSIAAQFADHGLQAPNNLSFTIVLNAIRVNAIVGRRNLLSPMEQRKLRRDAIVSSRQIWVEVISRWRKGDIWIDEELTAAMGRLLLIGQEEDWDDIFSLIQQTMNIPRQIPKLGTPARRKMDPASQGQEHPANAEADIHRGEADVGAQGLAVVPQANFESITVPVNKKDGIAMYAKPGPNILSLVLQATLDLRLKPTATAYWDIFTKSLMVIPDKENYHAYLRVLRVGRSSTETVEVVQAMPKEDMEPKTFRISMACCARDKRNPNSFKNAGKILDVMQMALRQPDIQSLVHYLEVAMTAPAYDSTDKHNPSKQAQGKQILRALDRLNPSFINLKSALQFEDPSVGYKKPHERDEFIQQILGLTKRMVSAYDFLMNKAMVPRDMYMDLTKQRSKFSAFITRYQHVKGILSRFPTESSEDGPDVQECSSGKNGSKSESQSVVALESTEIERSRSHFQAALERAERERPSHNKRSSVGL